MFSESLLFQVVCSFAGLLSRITRVTFLIVRDFGLHQFSLSLLRLLKRTVYHRQSVFQEVFGLENLASLE